MLLSTTSHARKGGRKPAPEHTGEAGSCVTWMGGETRQPGLLTVPIWGFSASTGLCHLALPDTGGSSFNSRPQCCGELGELRVAVSMKATLSPSPPVHPAPDLCGPLEMASAVWSRAYPHSSGVRILAPPLASFTPSGVSHSLSEPEL